MRMKGVDSFSSSPTPAAGIGDRGSAVRKKGIGVRAWLLVDAHGGTQVVEAGKHAIMRRTGLPARDLRILDPLLSYPSTILGRERAIVINLEHIKAIITAREVLLLNSTDPYVAPFVSSLQRRLFNGCNPSPHEVQQSSEGARGDSDMEYASKGAVSNEAIKLRNNKDEEDLCIESSLHKPSFLEVSSDLSSQAANSRPQISSMTELLEREAYPALDELAIKISTLNLERVRQLKSRLVAICARVQAVRDELEQLLDDDGDMNEMYLTDKLIRQQTEGLDSPVHSNFTHETSSPGADKGNSDNGGSSIPHSQEITSISNLQSSTTTSTNNGIHQDVEELEMLLEAYFVQTDGSLNKLSALREYVDDTEDYINMMLDEKQNHLLQMGVMMTTGTLIMSVFVVVTGIFGMNISISLFDTGGLPEFLWAIGGTASGAIFVYILVITWCRHKRLLE